MKHNTLAKIHSGNNAAPLVFRKQSATVYENKSLVCAKMLDIYFEDFSVLT
jgi:hypothetical protein